MKLAVLASLIASAAAFAPAKQASTVSSLNAFEGELGAQEPIGFYDPLNIVADGDEAKFQRLRYVELKHGRICMLAFLGQITTRAGIHIPGNIDLDGNSVRCLLAFLSVVCLSAALHFCSLKIAIHQEKDIFDFAWFLTMRF